MELTDKDFLDRAVKALNRASTTHRHAAMIHADAAALHESHGAEMYRLGRRAAAARAGQTADRERELAHREQLAGDEAQRRARSLETESD